MIDFSEYGKIVVHPNVSELGLTIQFFPDTRSKLGSMLRLLDDYLQPRKYRTVDPDTVSQEISDSLRDTTWGV